MYVFAGLEDAAKGPEIAVVAKMFYELI